jgi:dTDP-4-dehydrorhamnose 3,5-epimerase
VDVVRSRLVGFNLYKSQIHEDLRGLFLEWVNDDILNSLPHAFNLAQANMSISKFGVVRGMHFSTVPQTKILICVHGTVQDYAVDLRLNSSSFGTSESFRLDSQTRDTVVITPGLAHGFEVLSEEATLIYLTDLKYSPKNDCSLNFFDPEIGIKVRNTHPIVSERDLSAPSLQKLLSDGIIDEIQKIRDFRI